VSRPLIRIASAVTGVILVTALAACHTETRQSSSSPATTGKSPGSWDSQIQQMIDDFPSDFASQVFADKVVSEQELTEARKINQDCYNAAGLSVSWNAYGRETVEGADPTSTEPPSAMGRCSFADGGVMVMYYQMLLNPRNEDEVELRAACLVKAGIARAGYTGADLLRDYEAKSVPWKPDDEKARNCLDDPLGLVNSKTTQ